MATQTGAQPTVFVVDDDRQVREAIALLLDSVDLNVETFDSAEAFLKAYRPDRPGCLVLDVRMPGIGGLELQRQLVDLGTRIPTIFLTAHSEVAMAVDTMKAGAVDFIEKPYSPQVLLDGIHRALEQDAGVRQQQAEREHLCELFESLSPREKAVLQRLAAGMNSKQIAIELEITATTVDFHRRNLARKLHVESAIELGRVYEAFQHGNGP